MSFSLADMFDALDALERAGCTRKVSLKRKRVRLDYHWAGGRYIPVFLPAGNVATRTTEFFALIPEEQRSYIYDPTFQFQVNVPKDHKYCSWCGNWRHVDTFSPDKRNRDGLQSHCKACRNEHQRNEYEHAGKEKRRYFRRVA